MTTEQKNLSPAYEEYIRILGDIKRYYQGVSKLQNAATLILTHVPDNPHMMQVAQEVSAGAQLMHKSANLLYFKRKEIEKAHPDFKEKAMTFAKARKDNQD